MVFKGGKEMQFMRVRNLLMLKDSRMKATSTSSSSHRISMKFSIFMLRQFLTCLHFPTNDFIKFCTKHKTFSLKARDVETPQKQKDFKFKIKSGSWADGKLLSLKKIHNDTDTINGWFDKLAFLTVNLNCYQTLWRIIS